MSRLIIIGVFLLVAVVVFLIVWFAVNRSRSAARGAHPSSRRRRPVAPDDDPEFLRNLRLPDPPADDSKRDEPNKDDRG